MVANGLRQIGRAMDAYADQHDGRFPPAVLNDKEGRPLHSWRVLILPYLEEGSLYRQFRLDEPWDSAHNLTLLPRMPKLYGVPEGARIERRAEPFTTYIQVFVGKGTAFEGPRGLRRPDDFPDGCSNTALVVEAGDAIPWTKPVDVAYEPDKPLPPLGGVFTGESRFSLFGSNRIKGFHIYMADGFVRFVTPTVSEATLRDVITRNDGRILGPDW
jgi:hypothetical protein